MTEQEAIDRLRCEVELLRVLDTMNTRELADAITIILKALEKQINGGWVPCSERLPGKANKCQKRLDVLVTTGTGTVEEMYFEFESQMFWMMGDECHMAHWKEDKADFKVLAWMPKPEPYKEDKQRL